MTTHLPQDFGLEDLSEELDDHLDRYKDDYWEPFIEIISSYVSNFELRHSFGNVIANLWSDSNGDVATYRDRREELTSRLVESIDEADVSRSIQSRLARLGSQYESHQDYIIERIVKDAREEFQLRREGIRDGGVVFHISPPEAAEWIGLAASSGVIGNLAYDVLKRGWTKTRPRSLRRLIRRRQESFDHQVDPDEALAYLVKVAVREQCRRLDFTVPAITELRFVSWTSGPESVVASILAASSEMRATVEIPYSGIETRGLLVSISYTRTN